MVEVRTLYTPGLANAALPLVSLIVAEIVDVESRAARAAETYRRLKADPAKPQTELNEARRVLGDLLATRDACAAELGDLGVRLGDARLGVCDFPAELDGEPVHLCWTLGEERVEQYHPAAAGHATRRPLPVPVATG